MAHLDETLLLDDQEFDVTDIIKLQVDLENVHMGSRLRQLGLHFVPRVWGPNDTLTKSGFFQHVQL